MGERSHRHSLASRLGGRNSGGEIVEVQGGHIVRSIGRKDRHSKVCTSKGPRDRRVRLAAHTAIQFYDVQDRLGYDRPSKAVDWLIKNAKNAIDGLEKLPAWKPTTFSCYKREEDPEKLEESEENFGQEQQQQEELGVNKANLVAADTYGHSTKRGILMLGNEAKHQRLHLRSNTSNSNSQSGSFPFPSLNNGDFSDNVSPFPMGGVSSQETSSTIQFQSFQTPNLLSIDNNYQDLRLSLQSVEDPVMLHLHNQQPQDNNQRSEQAHPQAQVILSGIPLGFEGTTGWPEHQQHQAELIRFQRIAPWLTGEDTGPGAGEAAAAGYLFNSPQAPQPILQQLLGQNRFFSQRGPLQSNNTPVSAWMNPSSISIATVDQHQEQPHQYPAVAPMYPSSISGIGFADGFSGFHFPARIQGDVEEHDGYQDKLSSASSDSHL